MESVAVGRTGDSLSELCLTSTLTHMYAHTLAHSLTHSLTQTLTHTHTHTQTLTIARSYVQAMRVLIIDEIHLLGDERGPVLEVIVSRTNFIASHTHHGVRVVGLSTALANAKDLADWLGIKQVCWLQTSDP